IRMFLLEEVIIQRIYKSPVVRFKLIFLHGYRRTIFWHELIDRLTDDTFAESFYTNNMI
ncbi:hypothetical protein CEXT_417711, partial [Caerostris extrusa]